MERVDPIAASVAGIPDFDPLADSVAHIPDAPQAADTPGAAPVVPGQPPVPQPLGFWDALKQSTYIGAAEGASEAKALAQQTYSKATGGQFFPQQGQEPQPIQPLEVSPEVKAETDDLLQQPFSQNLTNPKWYGAKIAQGTGAAAPAIGAGAGAMALGAGAVPAALIGGGVAGLMSLLPNYGAQKAKGANDDTAIRGAVVDSGIDAATMAVMGLAPESALLKGAVGKFVSGPIKEALVNMGVVQPAIGAIGQEARSLVDTGKFASPDEIATDWVTNTGVGIGLTAAHTAWGMVRGQRAAGEPAGATAPAGSVRDVTAQGDAAPETPQEQILAFSKAGGPQGPVAPLDPLGFYSQLHEAIASKGPPKATAQEWTNFIAGRGVKQEELGWVKLPEYLAEQSSGGGPAKVSKDDLLAHIQSNMLRLEEKTLSAPDIVTDKYAMDIGQRILQGNTSGVFHTNDLKSWDARDALSDGRITQKEFEDYVRWRASEDRPGGNWWSSSANLPKPVDSAKYADYNLPGPRMNTREVMVKMPTKMVPGGFDVTWDSRVTGPQVIREDYEADAQRRADAVRRLYPDAEVKLVPRLKHDPETTFMEGHFEPNTLAHYRITDRVGPDGKVHRVIEEMQSDWLQRARKLGFRKPYSKTEDEWMLELEDRVDDERVKLRRKQRESGPLGPDDQAALDAYTKFWTGTAEEADAVWPQVAKYLGVSDADMARYQEGRRQRRIRATKAPPEAPFLDNWEELVFKRILKQAADEGITRLAWTTAEQQIARYGGLDAKQKQGMRTFYNDRLPKLAQKYARKMGMETGEATLDPDAGEHKSWLNQEPEFYEGSVAKSAFQKMRYLDISPAAASNIALGFPLFSVKGFHVVDTTAGPGGLGFRSASGVEAIRPVARTAANAIVQLAKAMKIDAPVTVQLEAKQNRQLGFLSRDESGYVIHVNLATHMHDVAELYATMAHEFGHVVSISHFEKAPRGVQLQLLDQWRRWRSENVNLKTTDLQLFRARDNAVTSYYETRGTSELPLLSLTPERQEYWTGFEEWFAENVARWATTSAKPLGVLDKWFHGLAMRIDGIRQWWEKVTGRSARPDAFMEKWLNSFLADTPPFAAHIMAVSNLRSQQQSQRSLDRSGAPEVQAEPMSLATVTGRQLVADSTRGELPTEANADAAHADRINAVYKGMVSVPQLAEVNPHITGLQYYREGLGLFNAKIRQDHEPAMENYRQWRKLHGPQGDAVAGLLNDWGRMSYLTDLERDQEVRRMPNKAEFARMVADNKVTGDGEAVFWNVLKHIDSKLDDAARILKQAGGGIKDASRRGVYEASVDAAIADERKAPYMPFMHDGNFSVELKGAVGETLYYARARTRGEQEAIAKRLESTLKPGETVKRGFVAMDSKPLTGIPNAMLDLIADRLQLSETQKAAVKRLKAEQKPQIAMIRRIRPKVTMPGYSADMMRSYMSYAFHTSRYFARTEWAPRFQGWIRDVRESNGNRREEMAAFMDKHYRYMMDPKPDFALLRGLIFQLRLGFSPTTAGLYLTQTPIATMPWLNANFGRIAGTKALVRAMTSQANYYKSATLRDTTDVQLKAQREAMRSYILDGGVAPELAGIAESANLTANTLRGSLARGWSGYQEAAGLLLHLADTWNRRVAFDAAWHAAMENPNGKYVERAKQAFPMEYRRLLDSGWTEQEAGAFAAGRHTVESTHFVYQRSHRPQVMWGKGSALLMFQFWKQNMTFMLWNYPNIRAESLLVMAGMAGLMGLPGAQDLKGIVQAIGWQLFGKDWNLDRKVREFVLDHWGPDREWLADALLHGASRYGMGVPTVLDLLGHSVGLPKVPTVDRSSAIGMGDMLPVDVGRAFGPTRDPASAELQTAQSVAGAAFGTAFDLGKFLTDSTYGWGDLKRWEPVIPHWMSNVSKAYRWATEGMERDAQGNPIVRFNANDTTQMMEILARGLGYTPTRLAQEYDRRSAKFEVDAFWTLRREALMRQAWDAARVKDTQEVARVMQSIRNYNEQLPPDEKTRAITGDQIKEFYRSRAEKAALTSKFGISTTKKDIPEVQRIKQLYPVLDEQRMGVK